MNHTCDLGFPGLEGVIQLSCPDRHLLDQVTAEVASSRRLVLTPPMVVREPGTGPGPKLGEVHLEAQPDGDAFVVSFSGTVSTRPYRSTLDGVVGDTLTIVLTVLQTALVPTSAIAIHAAFVVIDGAGVLVTGPSGGGKSSTGVVALAAGYPVYAAEICFVRHGRVVLGESALTIAAGAVEKFGLHLPSDALPSGKSWVVPLPPQPGPQPIDFVIFPRVGLFPHTRRRIPRRSAEVQTFEAVTSQAPVWRMVGGRSELVLAPWDPAASMSTIAQAFRLCQLPTWWVEGTPQSLLASATEIVAGAAH